MKTLKDIIEVGDLEMMNEAKGPKVYDILGKELDKLVKRLEKVGERWAKFMNKNTDEFEFELKDAYIAERGAFAFHFIVTRKDGKMNEKDFEDFWTGVKFWKNRKSVSDMDDNMSWWDLEYVKSKTAELFVYYDLKDFADGI